MSCILLLHSAAHLLRESLRVGVARRLLLRTCGLLLPIVGQAARLSCRPEASSFIDKKYAATLWPGFTLASFFVSQPRLILYLHYAQDRRKGPGNKRCFCLSVRPFVAYIANNSRTQRPSVPKFGRKVPRLRCNSRTSFKVKWSKVRVIGWRGHTVSAEPGGHTACLMLQPSLTYRYGTLQSIHQWLVYRVPTS